jgi:hypothetical protein
MVQDLRETQQADPEWFRQPTKAEHRLGGYLFLLFGVGFALLFPVLSGWWFRWVFLGLAVWSVLRGIWHLIMSTRAPH